MDSNNDVKVTIIIEEQNAIARELDGVIPEELERAFRDMVELGFYECTCALGRIEEHKRMRCTCTSTISECAVHGPE